ncbi:cytochrome b/b6 domain-containing protein [Tunturiibacter empetritectus]|uniref:Thiosulfate reductase cytochrome b subunit n=1 Tax=Tunturiibacter lichenicola TaxID=2051959 RepID=A0A852VF89_9BACT|nr:cytochrome b/b6 domain-containing protein [Edaphobacter lichenicola]NYF90247.1 thiosulfate reductase cytochrome b subunit [Edaphobacter lichenicola]
MRIDRKHPLAIRWMHWINFPVLFLMIWSGLLIYWNDTDNAYQHPHEIYRIGIGKFTLFHLFPNWFWKAMNAPYHVTQGLGHHFFFMWIFAANGIAYGSFLAISGEWHFLVPERTSLQEAIQVTLVDLHLRKGLPPQTKYNGAQRIAYSGVIVMGFGMLVSGLAIYKPTQLHWMTTILGGYEMARWEHFWITMGFLAASSEDEPSAVPVEPEEAPSSPAVEGAPTPSAKDENPSVSPKPEFVEAAEDSLEESVAAHLAEQNAAVLADSRKHTRRSFAVAAVAAIAGYNLYDWITDRSRLEMQPSPFRRAFNANASLSRTIFDDRALAPTYSLRKAENLRVNGVYGLKMELVPENYRLQLVGRDDADHPRFSRDVTAWEYKYVAAASHEDQGHDNKTPPPGTAKKMAPAEMVDQEVKRESRSGHMPRGRKEAGQSHSTLAPGTPGLLLTLQDVLRLPRHELVTQFKCIEGWSQIVYWAGRTDGGLSGRVPSRAHRWSGAEVRLHGDVRRRLLHRIRYASMSSSPDITCHGADGRSTHPISWSAPEAPHADEVRLQADQTHRSDQLYEYEPDDYWTKLGYDWYAGL